GLTQSPRLRAETIRALRNQHGRTGEATFAQIGERRVGLCEGISLCRRMHWYLRRESEEFLAVAARQIGDRADHAFFPQEMIGKSRDVAHMDAGADDGAALSGRCERSGHERAHGGEDQRGIERLRRLLARAAGPDRAEAPRELLTGRVSVAGKSEDALPAMK